MAKLSKVLKIAKGEIGVCESPRNSNRQKYGKDYGWNGVFWCAQFVWWLGWKADGKNTKTIAKSANAADIQDLTVSKYGGSWVMRKNKSSSTRKAYLKKAKPGDIVSFDFGAMDAIRDHVGIVSAVRGDQIVCIEGNTSKNGSQSNGGMVCEQARPYKWICSAVRPKYEPETPHKAVPYPGTFPVLPKRGWFQKGDKGVQVQFLQGFLNWAMDYDLDTDGEIGPRTVRAIYAFQAEYGLTQDGGFGSACLKKAKTIKK